MKTVTLKVSDFADIYSGGTPSTKTPDYWNGQIAWITPKDMSKHEGIYIKEGERFITEQGLAQSSACLIPPNTVILSTRAPVGYVVMAGNTLATNQGCKSLRCKDEVAHPVFVYYLLKTNTELLEANATGSTYKELSASRLKNLTFCLPENIDTQQKIASTLSAYDDLIENNRRRIQLLEKTARLLYKEWFVRLRFPGHEKVRIVDGVPEEWGKCGMMEHPYFEFIRENIGNFDGNRRYYATADISGIFITGEGIEYSYEEKPNRAQKAPEINSVWFARMQETYKVLVFTETNRATAEQSMLSSGFAGFRARQLEFLPFLFLLVNNERFHEEKDRFCTGATQRSLTNDGLKSIQVIVPSPGLMSAFAALTAPIINQILNLQEQNKHLARARDLLLPRLMNGKIVV